MSIVALAVTALLAVGYVWMFMAVRAELTQASLVAEEVQILAKKNAYTNTVRKVVRDTEALRSELDSYFVNEEDLVTFLNDLENLGDNAGAVVTVQSVQTGKRISKDASIEELRLALKADGSLENVFHLLSLIEAFPKAISLDKVRLTRRQTEGSWQGTFDVTVARVGEKQAAGAPIN
jgi:Tfp pilus assembly protein PilO